MIQQDYLLRLIEQFAQLLARVRRRRQHGDHQGIDDELNAHLETLLQGHPSELEKQPPRNLVASILQREGPLAGRDLSTLVAGTLYARYEFLLEQGQWEEARSNLFLALEILLELSLHFDPSEFPEAVPKVEAMIGELSGAELPTRVRLPYLIYLEKTGQYQAVINLYEHWTESSEWESSPDPGPGAEVMQNWYTRFQNRLRRRDEEDLIRGGIDRLDSEGPTDLD